MACGEEEAKSQLVCGEDTGKDDDGEEEGKDDDGEEEGNGEEKGNDNKFGEGGGKGGGFRLAR